MTVLKVVCFFTRWRSFFKFTNTNDYVAPPRVLHMWESFCFFDDIHWNNLKSEGPCLEIWFLPMSLFPETLRVNISSNINPLRGKGTP